MTDDVPQIRLDKAAALLIKCEVISFLEQFQEVFKTKGRIASTSKITTKRPQLSDGFTSLALLQEFVGVFHVPIECFFSTQPLPSWFQILSIVVRHDF